ncbi:hypothetical protein BLA29_015119 [Euroglyphus maynei]|uniref:Uncharacterized protein n=1 Tax=Euroglyphus maynei TaxID=6958 RepID=A0A1Y3BPE1_EURMA|nr:hypothetical protein BLA29_015119 [Euroglyphus maynei]
MHLDSHCPFRSLWP